MFTSRPEESGDSAAIHDVNTLAFGQSQEADLVDALRSNGGLTISLVAVQDGRIVGHIAFSPVTITSDTGTMDAIGLAPMAVLPEYQRRGIGSKLVEAGLHACHNTLYGVVVVLGHTQYYPRFGFTPAKPHGVVWEHDVSEEVFMVKELKTGALAQTKGVVKYRPEFEAV
jgi:putative acetyltransferase